MVAATPRPATWIFRGDRARLRYDPQNLYFVHVDKKYKWPAIGAVSIALNAKVFGEQGPAAILHGPLLWIVGGCAAFGVLGTLAHAGYVRAQRLKPRTRAALTGPAFGLLCGQVRALFKVYESLLAGLQRYARKGSPTLD